MDHLVWQMEGNTLRLAGSLDRESFSSLWRERETVMQDTHHIDVSGLERVDSAGLALLVHFLNLAQQQGINLTFGGVTAELGSLINLYNLQTMIIPES